MLAYQKSAYRHTVIVNLKTGTAFRGILWRRRRPLLILREAVLIQGGRELPADGDVLIPEDNVDYIQVFPTGEH